MVLYCECVKMMKHFCFIVVFGSKNTNKRKKKKFTKKTHNNNQVIVKITQNAREIIDPALFGLSVYAFTFTFTHTIQHMSDFFVDLI